MRGCSDGSGVDGGCSMTLRTLVEMGPATSLSICGERGGRRYGSTMTVSMLSVVFFFQAEDGIRDLTVTGVQTCALPILPRPVARSPAASASRPRLSSLSSVLGSRYTSPGSRCTSEPKRVTQNAPATVRTRTTATSGSATRRARRETLSSRVSDRVKLAPPVVDAKLRPAPSPRPPPRATAAHLDQRLTAPRYRLPSMVTVCTVLPPTERPRVDAAGDGCFTTLPATALGDALHAARRKRVDALVLSVHRCRGDELPGVARFVREFPAIPAVALVSHHDREVTELLLRLWATGVRTAVDCTEAAGWRRCSAPLPPSPSPPRSRIPAR